MAINLATLRFTFIHINHHDQTRSLAGHGAVRTHSKRIQKRIRSNAVGLYGVAEAMQRHGEADTVTQQEDQAFGVTQAASKSLAFEFEALFEFERSILTTRGQNKRRETPRCNQS